METTLTLDDVRALEAARGELYRFLSLACTDPLAERWTRVQLPAVQQLATAAAALLARDPAARPPELAPGELEPSQLDLERLVAHLASDRERLVKEHQAVFGLVTSKECPPYEVDYCPQTFTVYRTERLADIAGFYGAFGLEPGRDEPERPDHVALELDFLAWVTAKAAHARREGGPDADEHVAVCLNAERRFVEEHVAWWLPAFAAALHKKAEGRDLEHEGEPPRTLHGALARCLAAFVPAVRALLDVPPPTELAQPSEDEDPPSCEGCGEG